MLSNIIFIWFLSFYSISVYISLIQREQAMRWVKARKYPEVSHDNPQVASDVPSDEIKPTWTGFELMLMRIS